MIILVLFYLHLSDLGAFHPCNAFLRFSLADHIDPHVLQKIFRKFCNSAKLISSDEDSSGKGGTEYNYQLVIKDSAQTDKLVFDIKKLEGIMNVSLTVQEKLLEI